MSTPGPGELIVILLIVLIVFGPKRLPDVGQSLGQAMRGFKESLSGRDERELPEQVDGGSRGADGPTAVP